MSVCLDAHCAWAILEQNVAKLPLSVLADLVNVTSSGELEELQLYMLLQTCKCTHSHHAVSAIEHDFGRFLNNYITDIE